MGLDCSLISKVAFLDLLKFQIFKFQIAVQLFTSRLLSLARSDKQLKSRKTCLTS